MFLQHKSNQNLRLSRLKMMSQSIGSKRKTYVIYPCLYASNGLGLKDS